MSDTAKVTALTLWIDTAHLPRTQDSDADRAGSAVP